MSATIGRSRGSSVLNNARARLGCLDTIRMSHPCSCRRRTMRWPRKPVAPKTVMIGATTACLTSSRSCLGQGRTAIVRADLTVGTRRWSPKLQTLETAPALRRPSALARCAAARSLARSDDLRRQRQHTACHHNPHRCRQVISLQVDGHQDRRGAELSQRRGYGALATLALWSLRRTRRSRLCRRCPVGRHGQPIERRCPHCLVRAG